MRIDSLSLTNFRGFKEAQYSFTPDFNVIIGANATGKTSILHGLAVAVGTWMLGIPGQKRHIHQEEIRLECHETNGEFRYETQFPVKVFASGVVLDEPIDWLRTISSDGGRTTIAGATKLKKKAEEARRQVQENHAITLPLISYYGTERLWREPKNTSRGFSKGTDRNRISRLDGYKTSIDPRISSRALTQWVAQQEWIGFQQRKEQVSFQAVRDALISCLEDVEGLSFDAKRFELVVRMKNGNTQVFSNLSDGQRNILALVGDIAQKAATLNPHLGAGVLKETPGVVLIDELDLHLHPRWQRRIVDDLRRTFPKIQFIATTHSPFIIQTLRQGELITLDTISPNILANKGIEEISASIMGVGDPDVSPKYHQMLEVARSYLAELDKSPVVQRERLENYKKQLAEKVAPYAENPAFQAVLEAELMSKIEKK